MHMSSTLDRQTDATYGWLKAKTSINRLVTGGEVFGFGYSSKVSADKFNSSLPHNDSVAVKSSNFQYCTL